MAGTPFREARNVELSLLYYLEQNLAADWSGTTVVKTFKKVYARDTALPIVCVRLADTSTTRLEVGSDTLDNRYLLVIDIFVSDDGMRPECGVVFTGDGDFERKLIEFLERYDAFEPRQYASAYFANEIAARKFLDIVEGVWSKK